MTQDNGAIVASVNQPFHLRLPALCPHRLTTDLAGHSNLCWLNRKPAAVIINKRKDSKGTIALLNSIPVPSRGGGNKNARF